MLKSDIIGNIESTIKNENAIMIHAFKHWTWNKTEEQNLKYTHYFKLILKKCKNLHQFITN